MHCALHAECKGLWVWYYMLCIVMLSPLSQGYSGYGDLGSIPEGLIMEMHGMSSNAHHLTLVVNTT